MPKIQKLKHGGTFKNSHRVDLIEEEKVVPVQAKPVAHQKRNTVVFKPMFAEVDSPCILKQIKQKSGRFSIKPGLLDNRRKRLESIANLDLGLDSNRSDSVSDD